MSPAAQAPNDRTPSEPSVAPRVWTHLRFGWWSLLVFLSLGIVLEGMHGFKVGWYLDVASEVRRLMWRLAHAHGTLLSLLHVAFGLTLGFTRANGRVVVIASRGLMAASVLLPAGFLLGGVTVHGGDPGPAIALVPLGAAALFTAVFCTGWFLRRGARRR